MSNGLCLCFVKMVILIVIGFVLDPVRSDPESKHKVNSLTQRRRFRGRRKEKKR